MNSPIAMPPTLKDYEDAVRAIRLEFGSSSSHRRDPTVAELDALPTQPTIGPAGWRWSDVLQRLCLEDAMCDWFERHVDDTLEVPRSKWFLVKDTGDDSTRALFDKVVASAANLPGHDSAYPKEYGWLHFGPEIEKEMRVLIRNAHFHVHDQPTLEQLMHKKLRDL